ncbi:MAG TPA: hypothetical protein VHY58_24630 [Streptosporangiaceae bacterium]|jgi:hypothetical protein|nr:hypothetical protein [Streptosporangiaceae bacterium]
MTWSRLRAAAVGEAAGLRVPMPAGLGCCPVCRGPARAGYPRCFSCNLHHRTAPGLLADAVVPLSYSIAGTSYSRWLRMYKSASTDRHEARAAMRTLLLVFLHDHGTCLWATAGMTAPSHVAVVPSGAGRPGVHPLRALIEPYLALPWAGLTACGDDPVQPRELRVGRYRSDASLRGANVLLVDDTWASGASAQSAAAALKLAGAASVVILVFGRHVNPERLHFDTFLRSLSKSCFRLDRCAVHTMTALSSG